MLQEGMKASAAAKRGQDADENFLWCGIDRAQRNRTTQDELRTHTVQKSKTDLYQWLLMISTHSQRHLLQIQEIKASQGYPAK